MITDKIENLALYGKLFGPIDEVIQLLEKENLQTINSKVTAGDISIIPITGAPNPSSDKHVLEAHRSLMDIHITIKGEDKMAYACLNTETGPHKAYDEDNDYLLVKSNTIKTVTIPEGYFCIVPNNFAHMALYEISNDVKKVVIKIPCDK
jgi:YhcH/YjgK/YiaL family protein